MPHTGKPSGACSTCKQRHVRCDETRPSCGRCIKSHRICPGYAEGLDLVLRNQNQFAKASVSRRQKAAQKARDRSLEGQCRSSSQSRNGTTISSGISSPSPTFSEEMLALSPSYLAPSEDDYQVCLFMNIYALYPHDKQADRGYVELLPLMYTSVNSDSPLALCVAAISSALSAKFVFKLRNVETAKVQRKYTKALSATREALQNPVESLTDDTLMAVCLLGFYESAVESFRGRISSPRHFDGAAALIKQRQGRLNTDISKRLLLGVRNSIVSRALSLALPIEETSDLWQDFDSIPRNPATLLDQLSMGIPNLMIAAQQIPSPPSPPNTEASASTAQNADLLTKAATLDSTLSKWPSILPPTWHPIRAPSTFIPPSIPQNGHIYQPHCDLYPDIIICATWNSYRLARLILLAITARLSPSSSLTFRHAITTLQTLADDICASIPFCLGNRDAPAPLYCLQSKYPTLDGSPVSEYHHRTAAAFGWYLFGPMKEVMAVEAWLRPGQLAWMGSQLQRLARVYDVEPARDGED